MNTNWKIETHDYDFRDVPKEELEACCIYEFARESRAVRKMVEQLRNLAEPKRGAPNLINIASNTIQNQFLILISLASGFPSIGWQCLSEANKQLLLKLPQKIAVIRAHLERLSDPSPPLVFNFDPTTRTLESAIRTYQQKFPAASNDPIKIGFIALNLKFPDEARFIETFTRNLRFWLKGEPERGWRALPEPIALKPRQSKLRGRHSFRDRLNALGAMRLRSCCSTFREAKTKMESLKRQSLQGKERRLFYSDRRDLNRACETALHVFKEFSWLFGNSHCELPIHYGKGWKNKGAF